MWCSKSPSRRTSPQKFHLTGIVLQVVNFVKHTIIPQSFHTPFISLMFVYLRGITNKITRIEISPTDTVKIFKSKIQAKYGVDSSQQRLIFHGKQLDDEKTIKCYSVTDESTIQVCGYLLSTSSDSYEYPSQ
jgi:hypothetical protein